MTSNIRVLAAWRTRGRPWHEPTPCDPDPGYNVAVWKPRWFAPLVIACGLSSCGGAGNTAGQASGCTFRVSYAGATPQSGGLMAGDFRVASRADRTCRLN